jgi:hypothetical protein
MDLSDYVWTTKEGKDIRIRDMTAHHIDNTIAHLENLYSAEDKPLPPIYYALRLEHFFRTEPRIRTYHNLMELLRDAESVVRCDVEIYEPI